MDIEIKFTEDFSIWLAALRDRKARLVILSRLDRVAEGNFGDVAVIGEGISEIRIHYGPIPSLFCEAWQHGCGYGVWWR